jgi:hypothetical protein
LPLIANSNGVSKSVLTLLSQRAEMLKVEDFIILANEYETLTHPK